MSTILGHVPDPSRREPLWDRVDRNRIKLVAFVLAFVAVSVVVLDVIATFFGGILALVIIGARTPEGATASIDMRALILQLSTAFALVAFAWAAYMLSRSEKWLVKRFGAEFVPKGEELPTKMALKDMAIAAGRPMAPALYRIAAASSVNAFVFAASRRRAVVGVTQGFIDKLTVDEQRAVFANLVARLASGDTILATGITSIVWPIYAWNEHVQELENVEMDAALSGRRRAKPRDGESVLALVLFGFAFAIMGSLFEAGHRSKQRKVAEKADAEGMLLLKDPRSMLVALERCIDYDNVVPSAGEAFADLFYCWTGASTNDASDPECVRIERLREVLGVEGIEVDSGKTGFEDAIAPRIA